jgi:hypothetical protein
MNRSSSLAINTKNLVRVHLYLHAGTFASIKVA